ncbi:putative Zn-dependent protease [Parvibaculum indicum]|uniref:M48 family metalloprotease n=1 Tax=Parvibaculum indicum TaxID=562969 RepID=UPI001420CBF9|nr:M48 family metalloprotease [Parvibaculum indicum]NIJ43031.1 putative Zn-dependent protease [Parvibaculum indicum]
MAFSLMKRLPAALRMTGTVALSAALCFAPVSHSFAQQRGISLIRDAETEALLKRFSSPIWRAAGIDENAVQIHLVQDQSINAFVAGGQQLFINTGLITQSDTPGELIGVIAHEAGHMAGGHLARTQDALGNLEMPLIASMLLGVGAIAAGQADVGAAVLMGSQHIAQRGVLAYSREQESRADQAGATFLERAQLSGEGMLELFAKFRDQEVLSGRSQDPFVRSHPISEDRLAALRGRVESSRYFDKKDSAKDIHDLKMVQAKLVGFIENPSVTMNTYPPSDQSDFAHYARTVAYHQLGKTQDALKELEPVIEHQPDNPFVYELKGQILFESGNIEPAIVAYRKALDLDPREAQLRMALGQAILARDTVPAAKEALPYLQTATRSISNYPYAYYQLSRAYGRLDEIGLAELATAQYYDTMGNAREATRHARRAQKHLKTGTPDWLKAEDIASQQVTPRG